MLNPITNTCINNSGSYTLISGGTLNTPATPWTASTTSGQSTITTTSSVFPTSSGGSIDARGQFRAYPDQSFFRAMDENGLPILRVQIDDKHKCKYRVTLLPGVVLETPHEKPNRLACFLFGLFGIKWVDLEIENFADSL